MSVVVPVPVSMELKGLDYTHGPVNLYNIFNI